MLPNDAVVMAGFANRSRDLLAGHPRGPMETHRRRRRVSRQASLQRKIEEHLPAGRRVFIDRSALVAALFVAKQRDS